MQVSGARPACAISLRQVITRSPRMADFAQFIAAASTPGLRLDPPNSSWRITPTIPPRHARGSSRRRAAAGSCAVIRVLVLGRPDGPGAQGFDGTATELLDKPARKKSAPRRSRKPAGSRAVPSAAGIPICGGIAPLLEERGIVVDTYKNDRPRSRGRRTKVYCSSGAAFEALRARFGGGGDGLAGGSG